MLDNGNFGFVYSAVLKPYKYHVAVKLMNKKIFSKLSFKRFDFTPKEANMEEKFLCVDKELEAYIEIFSPYIVKLLGYGRDNTQRLFLVMEFMQNGSLEDFMINSKKNLYEIPLGLKLKIMLNIATGIGDIHAKNFIHADIKPKNVLLDASYTAKLCDLGSMKNLNFSGTYDNNTGGLYYLPMEFFMGKYDSKIDIYSFGLIMYHLFSGHRHSYMSNNQLQINKLGKIPLYFLKNMVIMATSMNPVERKTIFYYKNILEMYLKVLNEVIKKYALEESNQLDLVIVSLNDSILEHLNDKLDLKLELNGSKVSLDAFTDDKVRKGVDSAVKYLEEANAKNANTKKRKSVKSALVESL
jgi:serine/threonine protein kinase